MQEGGLKRQGRFNRDVTVTHEVDLHRVQTFRLLLILALQICEAGRHVKHARQGSELWEQGSEVCEAEFLNPNKKVNCKLPKLTDWSAL